MPAAVDRRVRGNDGYVGSEGVADAPMSYTVEVIVRIP